MATEPGVVESSCIAASGISEELSASDAFSCAQHAFGGEDTLYEAFVCSEMGSVCEMMPYAHIDLATCSVSDVL